LFVDRYETRIIKDMEYSFKAKLWEYRPENPDQKIGLWVFVSVPQKYYEDIKEIASPQRKGFGSVRVEVTIGSSVWKTSIFPDTKSGTYDLPVKKEVRKKEGIEIGNTVPVVIKLVGS